MPTKQPDLQLDLDVLDRGELLPRVQEILARIPEGPDRSRHTRFFTVAAETIRRLGAAEISIDHEGPVRGEAAIAAQLCIEDFREPMRYVDAFLSLVSRDFPYRAPAGQDVGEDFDLFSNHEETQDSSDHDDALNPSPEEEIERVLAAICSNLTHEREQLESLMNAATGHPATQLERVTEFRGRARSGIGEAVFLAARQFAVVRKEDVVPFYREDLDDSLDLRRSVAWLRENLAVSLRRLPMVGEGEKSERDHCLRSVLADLKRFVETRAYGRMRASDRRTYASVRDSFGDLVTQFSEEVLNTTLKRLETFLDSLLMINARELLVVHDRSCLERVAGQLGSALRHASLDILDAARTNLRNAFAIAEQLWGRDVELDELLKLLRHVPTESLEAAEIGALVRILARHLDTEPVPS